MLLLCSEERDESPDDGDTSEDLTTLDSSSEEEQLDERPRTANHAFVAQSITAQDRVEIRDVVRNVVQAEIRKQIKAGTIARLGNEVLADIDTRIVDETMAQLKREIYTETMLEVDARIDSKLTSTAGKLMAEQLSQARRPCDDEFERSKRYVDTTLEQPDIGVARLLVPRESIQSLQTSVKRRRGIERNKCALCALDCTVGRCEVPSRGSTLRLRRGSNCES
jgi:hypothetical protein